MKKAVMIAALVVIGTASIFAFGIGAQGGTNLNGGGGNAALTFKLDNLPWVFAVDGYFGNNRISVGATADMWVGTGNISKTPIGYFWGWGVAANIALGDPLGLGIAARVLGGLNFMLLDNFLELYLQVAWQPGFSVLPTFDFHLWNFPVAGGFRFWFK